MDKHRIPDFVIQELEDKLKIPSFYKLKGAELKTCCDSINTKLAVMYSENETVLSKFIGRPSTKSGKKEFFVLKSFERYVNEGNIRTDKLRALLLFLGYPPAEIDHLVTQKKSYRKASNTSLINGVWYFYSYDSTEPTRYKVKKCPVHITSKKDNLFDVKLDDLWGKKFWGNATLNNESLVFNLKSGEEQLFICAELADIENKNTADELIVNCGYVSNAHKGASSIGNIILSKVIVDNNMSEDDIVKKYFNKRTARLSYNKKPGANDAVIATKNERLIINFLSAYTHRDRFIKPFSPNNFETIERENEEFDKNEGLSNYDKLKVKFDLQKHVFYAFNRCRFSHDEVAVFKYIFEFSDEERRCKVVRHNLGNSLKPEFSGEMFLESQKIYMELKGNNMQRRKQLIAPFNSDAERTFDASAGSLRTFILKGITSSVSMMDTHHMALRELIICMHADNEKHLNFSDVDRAREFISYKAFCNISNKIIRDEEKLFLANHALSTLSFPSETDARFLHARQDKARKYHGHYLVAVRATHSPAFLKMYLYIDEMAQARLQMKYDNGVNSEIYTYNGICEFYNNNIHIGIHLSATHSSEQKHAEFIFDYIKEIHRKPFSIFTGKYINTDDENNAFQSRFIVIKHFKIKELYSAFSMKPGLFHKKELEELNKILQDELNIESIEEYLNS